MFWKGSFACCRYQVYFLQSRNLTLTCRHVNCAQVCRSEGVINIDKCVFHATIACLWPVPVSMFRLQWPSINVQGHVMFISPCGGHSRIRNVDPGISAQFIAWFNVGTCRQACVGACWHFCLYPSPSQLLANYAEPGVSGVWRLNPVMVFILVCGH